MTKLVNLTLTDDDCLNVRMALNATAIHWGELATAARNEGDRIGAATCERIRSDYHRLWELVNAAQECCAFHASGGDRELSCGGDTAPLPTYSFEDVPLGTIGAAPPVAKVRSSIVRDIRAQNGLDD
jgi:hypothetical protein